ncbi:hypothetical protein Golob_017467, partial [Gossypium lobatum]|nr:hypothetical protein [Gossypium lobatum]
SSQGFNEFQTELLLLCRLHHQHIVPLIGFCNDKGEMIVVYKYMGNGTLRDHIYGSGYDPLPWKQRLEICIVLFGVLCARKPIDRQRLNENECHLAYRTRQSILDGTLCSIIDPYLMGQMGTECFFIFIDIAYSCTCREGNSRPGTGEVELELQEKADSYKASLCAFVPQHKSRVDSDGVEGNSGISAIAQDSSD